MADRATSEPEGRQSPPAVRHLGDTAIAVALRAVDLGGTADNACRATATTLVVRALAEAVTRACLPGVTDVVPSPDRVTIVYDPQSVVAGRMNVADLVATVERIVAHVLAGHATPSADRPPADEATTRSTTHEIPVAYDGPDLDDLCGLHGIDRDTLVRLHAGPDYLVTAIGFVPGFPYLAGLPDTLVTPRRATPRTRVPAGSVGIGGHQTGIYPFATPGGWHLIGSTDVRLFDADRTPPALLQVGDRVRFVPRPLRHPDPCAAATAPSTPQPDGASSDRIVPAIVSGFMVIIPGLHTTVQDLGRPGHRAAGVPRSGAADQRALRLANLLVGNPEHAAALECTLTGPDLRFDHDTIVALVGAEFSGLPRGRPLRIAAGERLAVGHATRGCRGLLAIAGGIDVPAVLGSRATTTAAGLGGFHGRPLAAGDHLPLGRPTRRVFGGDWCLAADVFPAGVPVPTSLPAAAARPRPREVRFIPAGGQGASGQGSHSFADLGGEYVVTATSDRMGLRLDGPPRPQAGHGTGTSVAVLPGTVQVPPDGRPILLLADAQTIGGYPVAGQVITADLPAAAQLRPGDRLRFVPVTLDEAHAALRSQEADLARVRAALATRTMPIITIDLNCDLGEGGGHDAAIMPLVTSVNIACGAHAGDDRTMRETVALAVRHGVAIGAHPGHDDRVHFGRRELPLEPAAAAALVARQVAALVALAGDAVHHVKLHGALYHQVGRDAALAAAVAARLAAEWPRLVVVAAAGSVLAAVAREHGLTVAEEAFLDRRYADAGTLLPRSLAGAMIDDPAWAAAQAVGIVRDGRIATAAGGSLAIRADTLCVHGDGPDPVACLQAARAALAALGIEFAPPRIVRAE